MTEKTLTDEIITIIQSENDKIAKPTIGTIIKIYENDNTRADVKTTKYGVLSYVKIFGKTPSVDNDCVITFIDGSFDRYVGIC